MRAPIPHVVVVCLGLFAGACDSPAGDARGPAAPTAPALPVYRQPILITSGGDGSPVGGATVIINGDEHYSAANGEVIPDMYSGADTGAAIDVDVRGFLPRRTKLSTDRVITLWPVASDAEANAVREMIYRRGEPVDKVLTPIPSDPCLLTVTGSTAAIAEAWNTEADQFFRTFSLPYKMTGSFQYEVNELEVIVAGQARCAPVPNWGFCRVPSVYRIYEVEPDRVLHRPTIRRVLASFFLGPNPLPGLMNATKPLDELSAFETQTIRMILQRKSPNRWPDSDR